MEDTEALTRRYEEKEDYLNEQDMDYWRGHLDLAMVYEFAGMMGKNILEVGCNTGYLTALMAERFRTATGIDVNKKAIKHAKRKFSGVKNLRFVCCLASRMPFRDSQFDGAYCIQTLEHLFTEDIKPTLREISRVVKRNGIVVVILPRAGDMYDMEHRMRAYDPAHESFFYSEEDVERFFGELFGVVSVRHEDRANPGAPDEKRHNSWVVLLKNR